MKIIKAGLFGVLSTLLGLLIYYFYPYQQIPDGITIDKLVVHKSKRELVAYSAGKEVCVYTIALGKQPVGDKQVEGDFKTPEGNYTINAKNPQSGYCSNLGISYPDTKDKEAATKLGKSPGGDIKIHGLKNGSLNIGRFQRWADWTNGCIALTNEEIKDLYDHTPVGTPIRILP